ncbi:MULTISPECIES: TraB/GumN family protein [Methanosarcina]|uniref:Pheromone shutdown protein n=3 Tax=Methanosarcina barkeri TaxID=2208 RepID=A0A0E3QZX3_METBA|nr:MULTISPECIES: TraB/GumN family protein [Methanosarcina]AKB56513.1 Pheromone shutdown protein [Methanosarcina barkeri MS]AKB59983.1 Pheromone shutdown protein [Methanosarcina barkeri 227]OEC91754.1 conjugal transfer protein TraB [Methanosarcina sp. A14]
MSKPEITDSQDKDPDYNFHSTSQESMYSMDKLVTESAENSTSVGKAKISGSSINMPQEEKTSVTASKIEPDELETKLDISSEIIAESIPDSASEVSIPSSFQFSDAHQAEYQPSKIVLIGTAHVSEKSVAEVKAAIRDLKPDIVAVELCRGRYDSLKGNVQEKQVPIKDILSEGKVNYYVIHWLLAYVQKKIGEDMGVRPGAEMLSAMEEAESIGAKVALIDRDIQVTLQRFWGKMKFLEKVKMIGSLLGGLIGIGKGTEIDIDKITETDVVTGLVNELRDFAPTAAEVLIDERDAYLAGSILRVAAGGNKTVVVVIGAGHKPGVTKYLKNPKSIPPLDSLMQIPKKRIGLGKIVGFAFVAVIVGFFLLLLLSGVPLKLLLIAFGWWFIITGTLSAIGTLLAGGHPYSVLTAFSVAWLTTLHPLIAAGWFAGLVEAKQRNPTTADLKALAGVETFREMFKNKFMRVLLVASFANIGSMTGTVVAAYVMLHVTGIDPRDVLLSGFNALGL